MAGRYTQLHSSIWSDPDFVALSVEAQQTYLLITSQSDLSFAGVASYMPTRWARMSKDRTAGAVMAAVDELEAARFLFVDDRTEEVMVRTFVKHNKIYEQKQLRAALKRDYAGILSTELKRLFHAEQIEDVKALVGSPPEASPPACPKPARSLPASPTEASVVGQDLDLDLDLHATTSPSSAPAAAPTEPAPPVDEDDEDVIHAAAKILAQRKLERLKGTPGEVHVPSKWLPPVIDETWRNHVETAERIIAKRAQADPPKRPLTAEELADRLEPPANFAAKEPEPSPLDTTLAASLALAEEGTRYSQEIAAIPRDPNAANRMRELRKQALHGEAKPA